MLYENKNCQIMTNTRLIFSSWQTSTSMGLTNYRSLKLPLKQLGGYMTQKKHRRFVGSLPVQYYFFFTFIHQNDKFAFWIGDIWLLTSNESGTLILAELDLTFNSNPKFEYYHY